MKRDVAWSQSALDDVKRVAGHIAADSPSAARRVGAAIREAGNALGVYAIGRPGRVSGTYEKSVSRLPYIVAYAIRRLPERGEEIVIFCGSSTPAGTGGKENGPSNGP